MYAGFWKRFGAFTLDWIIIAVAEILFIFIWALFELILNVFKIDQSTKETILGVLGVPIYICIPWLYNSLLESSKLKATVGKMALNIVVVDINENKISFLRASARYWSKFISALIFLIGFIMAGITKEKRALHDIISGTLVIEKRINASLES